MGVFAWPSRAEKTRSGTQASSAVPTWLASAVIGAAVPTTTQKP
jgi:hypothetical protein